MKLEHQSVWTILGPILQFFPMLTLLLDLRHIGFVCQEHLMPGLGPNASSVYWVVGKKHAHIKVEGQNLRDSLKAANKSEQD